MADNMVTNRNRGHFKGEVYLVNPSHGEIRGEKCYPSISAVPSSVETIVVAIPATKVPDVIEEAGKAETERRS
jgi:acetyl-CoA synthetase (ADP-forming)